MRKNEKLRSLQISRDVQIVFFPLCLIFLLLFSFISTVLNVRVPTGVSANVWLVVTCPALQGPRC
jgi:uncharacterized membrane protein (DUF485 family)